MKRADEDMRVYKTQNLIREAFCELMKEKSLNKISVRELTDKIHISRATFYTHYADVFDLAEKMQNEILESLEEAVKCLQRPHEGGTYAMMLKLFTFVKDNEDICTVMLSENGQMSFQEKLKKIVVEHSKYIWKENFQKKVTSEFEHYITFNFGGCIAVLQNWIRTGMKESPEAMANLVQQITRGNNAVFEIL